MSSTDVVVPLRRRRKNLSAEERQAVYFLSDLQVARAAKSAELQKRSAGSRVVEKVEQELAEIDRIIRSIEERWQLAPGESFGSN
jgi:hypothetical protein